MKTHLSIVIILLMTLLLLTDCKKESESGRTSQINDKEIQDCYNLRAHDSITVVNKLIGVWVWQEQSCMNTLLTASSSKVVKATFNSTGLFAVTENSNVIELGNWKIKMFGSNLFGVDSTAFEFDNNQPSSYLNGVIVVCDSHLILNGSYADGCNTLFTKEQ